MKTILEKLINTPSVPGCEELMRELITKELSGVFDEITTDTLGNLICHKGSNGTKKAFVAHMDSCGLIATYSEGEKVNVAPLGNINAHHAAFRKINFFSGQNAILLPPENLSGDTRVSDFIAHLGSIPENEIQQGTKAYFENSLLYLENDYISAFSLSTLLPLACMIKAAKTAVFSESEVYFIFTVQEQLGARGALSALFKIQPDEVYNICAANLSKSSKPGKAGLSSGVCFNVMGKDFNSSQRLVEKACSACKDNAIDFALFSDSSAFTDASLASKAADGCEILEVCIPVDNFGSAVELATLSDADYVTKLIMCLV